MPQAKNYYLTKLKVHLISNIFDWAAHLLPGQSRFWEEIVKNGNNKAKKLICPDFSIKSYGQPNFKSENYAIVSL